MEVVLATILCFGILSVLIALLFRGNNKSKRKEYIDTLSKKEYQELYKNVEEEVYDSLARTFDHHTELERDMLVTNIFRFVQKEKAESYKEGFWNGQKAKIEEVKFSDKDALSKDEIEDIKKSLKQQDYTNPLS